MGPNTIVGPILMNSSSCLSAATAATQATLAAVQPALGALAAAHRTRPLVPSAGAAFATQTCFSTPQTPACNQGASKLRGARLLRALAGSAAPSPMAKAAAQAWSSASGSCALAHRCLHASAGAASGSPTDLVHRVVTAAQQQTKDVDLLMSLARDAGARAASGQLSPHQIRDLCVAFADLGFFDVGFKSAMAEAIIPKLSTFEPTVLADTMHAYGMAQYYDFELMREAVSYLKANADRFDATGLAKMLWSFGRCGFQDDALMSVMHDVAEKLADSCDSTSLADVVYAEAQMGWADQRLAELVADYAADNIETFDASSLNRLLAGLASVGYDDDDLAKAAGRHACTLLETGAMSPKQLVPLLWAFGLQGHYHQGLMARAEALLESSDIVDALTPDELHVLVDAFNNLGCHGPGITSAAARLNRETPTIRDDSASA